MRPMKLLNATGAAAAIAAATLIVDIAPARALIMPAENCAVWAVFDNPPTDTGGSTIAPTSFQTSAQCPAADTRNPFSNIDPTLEAEYSEMRGLTGWIINLPNWIDELPLKKIWIDVTTNDTPELEDFMFAVTAQDSSVMGAITGTVESVTLTGEFSLHAFLTIEPNPDRERIRITCSACGGESQFAVTSIEIHTISTEIPEPASFALFGLGLAGLGFARRKRAA